MHSKIKVKNMDAFFVKHYEFEHPYFLRLWCPSTYKNSSYLLTFDGVKIRLFDFITHQTIKEIDFLNHLSLSNVISIYHPGFSSRAIFLFVRDRRNIWAHDDQLNVIESLSIDTSIIILAMVWSQSKQILYISGNFGWIRALQLKVSTSISGTVCTWVPVWTKHDNSQWMQHLALDETRGYLFGASGIDIFVFALSNAQLLLKFDTKHTQAITSLRYSTDRLLLFTASSDGNIKIWRIFERKPDLIRTIKQIALGPLLVEIDPTTMITLSYERIIRRYNVLNGNVLGSLDLDSSTALDQKNVNDKLQMVLQFTETSSDRRQEWLLKSEKNVLVLYEIHYAPRELAICCDIVTHVVVDNKSQIFALCQNNILHIVHTDASDGRTIDLDTIRIANNPNNMLNPCQILHMVHDNQRIFFAYESGEIKILDTNTYELYEMSEPDLGITITSICIIKKFLLQKHLYCPSTSNLHSLICTSSSNQAFTLHCPLCYHFISSWKLQNEQIVQMEQMPNRDLLVVLDASSIRIYKERDSLITCITFAKFEDEEAATCFSFAADDLIIVAKKSGKATIYDFDLIEEILTQRFTIRMHSHEISQMLSCSEIKKLDDCSELYDEFDLNGMVCSIGIDDTFKIIDCYSGLCQYYTDLPIHKFSHTVSFVYQAKLMLAISIDQNIRLFDFPQFERVKPNDPETPPSETKETSQPKLQIDSSDEYDEPIRHRSNSKVFQTKEHSDIYSPIRELNRTDDNLLLIPEIPNNKKTIIPIKKTQKVDLVFENGYPKLKFQNLENTPIEEKQEEENIEPEQEYEYEYEYEYDYKEVELDRKVYLQDIFRKNNDVLNDGLLKNENLANTAKSHPIKKIIQVNENDFLENMLSPDITHYEKKKKEEEHKSETNAKNPLLSLEKPNKIPKIGTKHKSAKKAKHFLIIEFENGQKVKTSEFTREMLEEIATADVNYNQNEDLTPGWVFQKALKDLNSTKKRVKKPLLIREQELVALPIFTLTAGGLAVGPNSRRFFSNSKPIKKFIDDDQRREFSWIRNAKDGTIKQNRFLHWEGVDFNHFIKKSHIVGLKTVVEEVQPEEEEEEEDRIDSQNASLVSEILKSARRSKLHNSRSNSDEDEFDPQSFNIFEKNNQLSQKLVTSSPSIQAITSMIDDDDDNPLLSLIKNAPAMTPDQLRAQYEDDRLSQIAQWHKETGDDVSLPNIVNNFTFEGLSLNSVNSSTNRPASPRPMDALAQLTKRMEINGPLLPAISEDQFGDISASGSYSEYEYDDDSWIKQAKSVKLTRTQSIIQEHLQRTDFQTLRDALQEAGLINDNILIDLPKWQPTINLVSRHLNHEIELDQQDQISLNSSETSSKEILEVNNQPSPPNSFVIHKSSSVERKQEHNKKNYTKRNKTNKEKKAEQSENINSSSSKSSMESSMESSIESESENDVEIPQAEITRKTNKILKNEPNQEEELFDEFNSDYYDVIIEEEEEDEEEEDLDKIIENVFTDKKERKKPIIFKKKIIKKKVSHSVIKNNEKVAKEFGLTRDGKKIYKIPKNDLNKLKSKNSNDPIKEIRVKSKDKQNKSKLKELLPGQTKFKSSKIKSLLKDRDDHISIDFGDPGDFKSNKKKNYIKFHDLFSNDTKLNQNFDKRYEFRMNQKKKHFKHRIGTKNPLFMDHGSDSDQEETAIFDDTIKNVMAGQPFRKTKSCEIFKKGLQEEEEEEEEHSENQYEEDEESEEDQNEEIPKDSGEKLSKLEEPVIRLKNLRKKSPRPQKNSEKIERSDDDDLIKPLKSVTKNPYRRKRTITKKEAPSQENLLQELNNLIEEIKEDKPKELIEEEEEEEEFIDFEEEIQELPVIQEEVPETPEIINTDQPNDNQEKEKKKKKKRKLKNSRNNSKEDFSIKEIDQNDEFLISILDATYSEGEIKESASSSLADLLKKHPSRNLPTEKPKILGNTITLVDFNEFQSVKQKKVVTIKKNKWGLDEKVRPKSANYAVKDPEYFDRKKMYMLGKVDMLESPQIFMSYSAQTLWDKGTGKLRRNSFDNATKNVNMIRNRNRHIFIETPKGEFIKQFYKL